MDTTEVCFVNYIPLPITDLPDVFAVFDKVDCIKASDVHQNQSYCADVFVDKTRTLFHMTHNSHDLLPYFLSEKELFYGINKALTSVLCILEAYGDP